MIPVGYIVGGAVLFGIGYATYELLQAIKAIEIEAANTVKPVQEAYNAAQQYAPAVGDAALLGLAINPMTAPFSLAYELYEAI